MKEKKKYSPRSKDVKSILEVYENFDFEVMKVIGWITTWGIKCGIATYSRFLIEQMDDDVVVLCQSGKERFKVQFLVGKRFKILQRIMAQIAAKGIDTIVIQHQPGL